MRPSLKKILLAKPSYLPAGPALVLDASREDLLFTSNAGTGAISDGATVGYWGDASGNAFNMTSTADDTTRPTWRANGGKPYVEFDGTNDKLKRTASLGLYAAAGASGFFALNSTTPGTDDAIFCESQAANQGFYSLLRTDATTASSNAQVIRTSGGANTLSTTGGNEVYTQRTKVVGFVDRGASVDLYMDGIKINSSPTYVRIAAVNLDVTVIGAYDGLFSPQQWAKVNIFAGACYKRVLSERDIGAITKYLGKLAGI